MFRAIPWVLAGVCLLAVSACRADSGQRVDVDLTEWAIAPATASVNAGAVTFVAHNRSASMVHELVVLKLEAGARHEVKEIEDIGPGKTKRATVTLAPGEYELACVIAPGEAGSTVDHYQMGMHTRFSVR